MSKILIIDDKQDNLVVVKALLNKLEPGFTVITAGSGKSGIKLAETENPDTILLDVHMPEMDGYEVCRQLRSNKRTNSIPIIFLTAMKTSPSDRIKGLAIGGDAYLSKPIDEAELLATLHAMLRIKKAEDERLQQYKDIVSSSEDLMALLDNQYVYLVVNKAYAAAFGKTPEEVIGKTPTMLFNQEFFNSTIKPHADQCLKGKTVQFQAWVDFPGNKRRFLDITYAPHYTDRKVTGFVVNAHDITRQKEIEISLEKSEQRYKTLSELTSDYLYALRVEPDNSLTLEWVAGSIQRLTGYTSEALAKLGSWVRLIHRDDLSVTRKQLETLLTNKTCEVEYRIITKSKKILWVKDKARPTWDEHQNRVVLIEGSVQDITERKLAQNKIRESEEKYRGIFNESIAAIYLFDVNKQFIDSNRAGLELLGYSRNELIGMHISQVDADPKIVLPEQEKLLTGQHIVNYEHQLLRKDGHVITVLNNSRPLTDPNGKVIGMLSTLIDITERKRALELLEQNEKKFRNIFDSFIDVYYRMDRNGTITLVSPSVSKYGYKPEEIVGEKGHNYYYDIKDRKALVAKLEKYGKVNDYEVRLKDANGKPVWISVNAEFLYDERGNRDGIQAVLRNISDRKRAEEETRILLSELETIFNSSPVPLVVIDSDRKVRKANHATENFTQLHEREMLGKRGGEVFKCLHSLDVPEGCGFGPDCKNCALRNTVLNTFQTKVSSFNIETELPLFQGGEYIQRNIRFSTSYFESLHGPRVIVALDDITEQKKTEQALQSSEEFSRSVTETAGDAIISINAEGIVLSWNTAAGKIFDYSSDEMIGKDLLSIIPKQYQVSHHSGLKRMINNGKGKLIGHTIELSGKRKDGTEFPIELTLSQWEKDTSKYFVGIIRDITERKQAEETLYKSEKKFKEIANSIPGVVYQFMVDNDGMYSFPYMNEKSKKYFQISAQELEKDANLFFDMVPREEMDAFVESIEKSKEYLTEWKHDFRVILPDGQIRWFEGRSVPHQLPTGEILWNGVATDVTTRKQASIALQESEQKFRGVVEQSNDGIYVLKGKRFVFVNPRFQEITGYDFKEINGEDFDFKKMIAPESLGKIREREAKQKRGEVVPERYIFRMIRKDGEKRDIEVSVTMVDWNGEPAILGIMNDVTERIKNQKELKQALEKAQAGEKVKSLFLANMSHEIRTPLNGILGFMDLIERRARKYLSKDESDYFKLINENANRLMNTVHEILDISQIEAGTYKGSVGIHSLQNIVTTVVDRLTQAARDKELDLVWVSPTEDDLIHVDEYAVYTAIYNIVDNAIKYTEQGKVEIIETVKDKNIRLLIKDTGVGIGSDYYERLFEPFTQESEGYTKKYQGIGLGMAIAKRHLDMNHVALTVESEKGVGTAVTLAFEACLEPQHKEEKPAPKPVVAPAVSKSAKSTILVVEDDFSTQKLMSFLLKKKYDLCFAVSVKEAKRQLKDFPVNLVLLDLSLIGNEDGLDLVKWMRKSDQWKDTPVVATTAHALLSDRENCLNAGCNDYLSKPILPKILFEKILEYLP